MAGQPVGRFIRELLSSGGTFPLYPEDTGAVGEQELVLEPEIFINVWNCQASLAAEFCLPKTSSTIVVEWPYSLPKRAEKAIGRDIWKQGGGLTMSGRYKIFSRVIWNFVKSRRFQE